MYTPTPQHLVHAPQCCPVLPSIACLETKRVGREGRHGSRSSWTYNVENSFPYIGLGSSGKDTIQQIKASMNRFFHVCICLCMFVLMCLCVSVCARGGCRFSHLAGAARTEKGGHMRAEQLGWESTFLNPRLFVNIWYWCWQNTPNLIHISVNADVMLNAFMKRFNNSFLFLGHQVIWWIVD